MEGTILTPTAVWKDFAINGDLTFEIVGEEKKGEIQFTRLYLNGRTVEDGAVKIYGVLARNLNVISAPAVLSVLDFKNGADACFAERLAKEGYASFTVDVAGEYPGREAHTIYPKSLSYANYNPENLNKAAIEGEVCNTFWYEWGCVVKYALAFLRGQRFVSSVGTFGINAAAAPLWYAVATEKNLACAVFVGNAGWNGYRGSFKFENSEEPEPDDDRFKFLAAADPQAYARHVACPVYILSPTNSDIYDVDRACDTAARINENYYAATDYSQGSRETVDYGCFTSALVFMKNYLYGGKKPLPAAVSLKAEIVDGEISVEVAPETRGLKKLALYVAEGAIKPQYRCWKSVEPKASVDGKYVYSYQPYAESGMASFYAEAIYADGFRRTSPVVYKFFAPNEVKSSQKFRILYSSRITDCETAFYPAKENLLPPFGTETEKIAGVELKKGPMDMHGISCARGILTFKVNGEKYRPMDGMLLMLDVYGKTACDLTVKMIADYFGKKTEYCCTFTLVGGDIWQNVKIEQNRFKTFEGMILKTYEKIEAIEFSSDKECVINNVLWV